MKLHLDKHLPRDTTPIKIQKTVAPILKKYYYTGVPQLPHKEFKHCQDLRGNNITNWGNIVRIPHENSRKYKNYIEATPTKHPSLVFL